MVMITVSKEDYLKAILEAEGEGEQVICGAPGAMALGLRAGCDHGACGG